MLKFPFQKWLRHLGAYVLLVVNQMEVSKSLKQMWNFYPFYVCVYNIRMGARRETQTYASTPTHSHICTWAINSKSNQVRNQVDQIYDSSIKTLDLRLLDNPNGDTTYSTILHIVPILLFVWQYWTSSWANMIYILWSVNRLFLIKLKIRFSQFSDRE